MTGAVLIALLAGAFAAAAIVEIAGLAGAATARRVAAADPLARARARRLAGLLAALGRRAGPALAPPGALAARLVRAGLGGRVGVQDVMALKVGCALVAALVGLLPAAAAPGRLGPVVAFGVPAAAFLAPDAWLRRRARRRAAIMADELPEVLDLLRVVMAAGMPLGRAMAEVGARRGGLLASELAGAADRMALGVPRADAMAEWRARCPLPAAGALVVAVGRSDRHGAPLAPALAALAADARADRVRRLGDRAARAAPKIQLVVALLLVPAVLLLVAAALLGALT